MRGECGVNTLGRGGGALNLPSRTHSAGVLAVSFTSNSGFERRQRSQHVILYTSGSFQRKIKSTGGLTRWGWCWFSQVSQVKINNGLMWDHRLHLILSPNLKAQAPILAVLDTHLASCDVTCARAAWLKMNDSPRNMDGINKSLDGC